MKPEAYRIVNEVMKAYKNSMGYKVGEALEARKKEIQKTRKDNNKMSCILIC